MSLRLIFSITSPKDWYSTAQCSLSEKYHTLSLTPGNSLYTNRVLVCSQEHGLLGHVKGGEFKTFLSYVPLSSPDFFSPSGSLFAIKKELFLCSRKLDSGLYVATPIDLELGFLRRLRTQTLSDGSMYTHENLLKLITEERSRQHPDL